MSARICSPDDEHRPFVITADWLTGYRVDECQSPGSDETHFAGCLDSLFKPADGRISRNQHDGANLVLSLRCGFLHEWRDVAVWGIHPGVAGNGEVISPRSFQRVLLGGDELSAQRIVRRGGRVQLKAEFSIQRAE